MKEKDLALEAFLDGKNERKYVVAVECDNYSTHGKIVVHDPEKGKYIEEIKYSPFLFMKEIPDEIKTKFYKNSPSYKKKAMEEHGISIKRLRTTDKNNQHLERLFNGYKYLISTNKTFNDLTKFFKFGGIDIYKQGDLFFRVAATEQFMIQSGIRLFKGYEFYNDIHKAVFDIETTGLDPNVERCFLIGLSDNKGYERIFEIEKDQDDAAELKMILDFFSELNKLKPAIISGYNSENFDFSFLLKRLEILDFDVEKIKMGLDGKSTIKRKEGASLKLGGETEIYTQTLIFGYNIIDIYHSVRRAKAINSEIKEAGLKYITKFSGAAKPDRMYIDNGFNIYKFWRDNNTFLINKDNNEYVLIPTSLQDEYDGNKDDYSEELINFLNQHPDKKDIITGSQITKRYLLDDLWETKEVDLIYNESTFMVSKWLPAIFTRSATIGGASSWNMIMTTWSFENNISIPYAIKKRAFVGGISRTFRLGFLRDILKSDYAGLYPSIQLEDNVFPIYDVDSVLYRLLKYFKETRDVYKQLAKVEKDPKKNKFYDTKQLPLKIFNNSNFGANGSEYFNWSDMDIAERITCSGRQYLRKMIYFFTKFGFQAAVVDTDGANYSVPLYVTKNINTYEPCDPIKTEDVIYTDRNGIEHKGLEAFFEKFNQDELDAKYMKVDNDGQWVSGINLARKNYVSFEKEEKNGKIKEKLKLVGNSIKSSNLPKYAEEFIKKGLDYIVRDQPKDFIDLYYKLIEDVYYRQVPVLNIASKAKVKRTLKDYCKQVYIPYLMKTLFLYENIDLDKEMVKYCKKHEVDIEGLIEGQLEQIYESIYNDFFISFKKELAKVRKSSKIEKLPFNKIQSKIDFIIEKGFHKNQVLPEFLEHKGFEQLFSNDFILNVYDICDSIQTIEEFTSFNKQLKSYLAIQGNKNGSVMPRQTFMDLLIDNKSIVSLGDMVYYINIGEKRTNKDGDIDKNGNLFVHLLNDKGELFGTKEDDKTKVLYNIDKYIDDINTKIEALLVVFKESVKNTLMITNPADKQYYTEEDLVLVSWDYDSYPYDKMEDIDDLYQDAKNVALFKMEDREVKYWNKIGVDPRIIFDGFTTDKETIDVNPYYDKYRDLKPRLKKKNIDLKHIKGRYEQGDVVLITEDDKFYLSIYENGVFHKEKEV